MMTKAILLHNPRCSKSRDALKALEDKGITFTVRDYQKDPLSLDEVKSLLSALNKTPIEMMRVKDPLFKALKISNLDEVEQAKAITKHPLLLERPIFWKGKKAAIGRPLENILSMIV
ncbi:MAG: arsenate reductase (glutaredoxin) [Legionellales bacterium]|nr:arsenate reductase (glutaredoxin) [Legionellales bacterium]|tara:strand:- start:855 stop:1205 length:351 start_codon:yes stop_codon:yes gene_type:complete